MNESVHANGTTPLVIRETRRERMARALERVVTGLREELAERRK
jgi:hypothetical protein